MSEKQPIWTLAHWNDLSKDDWDKCVKTRIDVFVVEQECPYPELDGKDRECWHLFAKEKPDAEVIAYLRVVPPGLSYADLSIGRVLTAESHRGVGLGFSLMNRAVDWIQERFPDQSIRISAQVPQIDWYGQWSFETCGEPYLEDDIPHIEMLRKPQS